MVKDFTELSKESPIDDFEWEHIVSWVKEVCHLLASKKNNFSVVGIGIGGSIVGRILALNLNFELFRPVDYSYIPTVYIDEELVVDVSPIIEIVKSNLDIVLVDFDISSGTTLKKTLEEIIKIAGSDSVLDRLSIYGVCVSQAGTRRYQGGRVKVEMPYYCNSTVALAPWMITQASLMSNPRWYWNHQDKINKFESKCLPLPKYKNNYRDNIEDRKTGNINGKIFIGHGKSTIWALLQIFIQNELKKEVITWESESRGGKTNIDILKGILNDSCFAILMLTADDIQEDGRYRARQNVIHEIGLFQSKLGFEKVALLVENGIEEFSNIIGLQVINFTKDSFRSAFYELDRMMKREKIIS